MADQTRSALVWLVAGLLVGGLGGLVLGEPYLAYLIAALVGSLLVGFIAQISKVTAVVGNPLLADGSAGVFGAIIGVLVWIFLA